FSRLFFVRCILLFFYRLFLLYFFFFLFIFFLSPISTLFPYTTLFRSSISRGVLLYLQMLNEVVFLQVRSRFFFQRPNCHFLLYNKGDGCLRYWLNRHYLLM